MLPVSRKLSESLDELIARRVDFLTDYQDAAYANRYLALVNRVRDAEKALGTATDGSALGSLPLTEAVARYFSKLMAYKDEYEVARLYTSGSFADRVQESFEGDFKLHFHLAPPLFSKRNARGELVKREFGPWVFKLFGLLAGLRRLRGTALDLFGRTEERRRERALIDEYEATISKLISQLTAGNRSIAVDIASVPEHIRGFGHVKARNMDAADSVRKAALTRFESQASAAPGTTQAVTA